MASAIIPLLKGRSPAGRVSPRRLPGTERRAPTLKPIEAVEPGDSVWSWDARADNTVKRRIRRLFRRRDRAVLQIGVRTASGTAESIVATTEHPFWVDGRGWVPAGELKAGDLLKRIGNDAPAHVLEVTDSADRADVYNFEVADTRSYFVGSSGILVHNHSSADADPVVPPVRGFVPANPAHLPSWRRADIADRSFRIDSKAVMALNELGLQNRSAFPSSHYTLENGQAFQAQRLVRDTLLPGVLQPTDLVELGKGAFKTCYAVAGRPDLVFLVNQPHQPPGVVFAEMHANQSQAKLGMPVIPMLSFHAANLTPGAIQVGFLTDNLGPLTQPLKFKSLLVAAKRDGLDLYQFVPETFQEFFKREARRGTSVPVIEMALGEAASDSALMARIHDGIYQHRSGIASQLAKSGRPVTRYAVNDAIGGLWAVHSADSASVDTQFFLQKSGKYGLGDAAAHLDAQTAPIVSKYDAELDLVPLQLKQQMSFNKGFAVGLEIVSLPPTSQVPDDIRR